MKLFTAQHKKTLLANGRASQADANFDPWPVVKFFTPWASCTWLVTEIDPDEPNRLWVLADLGLDCCEYGTVWLTDLLELRGPAGLRIERDRHWKPQGPISAYIRASGGSRLAEHLPEDELRTLALTKAALKGTKAGAA
jgi:hypothetical protein